MEFGTGCLKVTPAHDTNDYELGKKHNLETIDIFNDNGTLNSLGLHYEGKDRFEVRKLIEKELYDKGYLVKTEDHINKVGFLLPFALRIVAEILFRNSDEQQLNTAVTEKDCSE